MVIITIDGKKREREFPNMAHALAFAYQNGECYNAKKIELAYAEAGEAAKEPAGTPIGPEGTPSQSGAGVDNPNQTGAGGSDNKAGKKLEEMNKEQLLAYALEAKINVNYTANKDEIIAIIKEALKNKGGNP